MKTITLMLASFLIFLQAALSENENIGTLRYQELRFDNAGFPTNIRAVFQFPKGITFQPTVVVAYREDAATNTPGRYEMKGGSPRPSRILPDGSWEWSVQIDVDDDVDPGDLYLRGKKRWRLPMSASGNMVFNTNQGLVPLLELDGILICIQVSLTYTDNALVTKWMMGEELPMQKSPDK